MGTHAQVLGCLQGPGHFVRNSLYDATVQGATWAQRIELMPPAQAEQLLRSLARLPGGATLGATLGKKWGRGM